MKRIKFNIALGCHAFPLEQDNLPEDHMKPAAIETFTVSDRLATWNEVYYAMSLLSNGAHKLRSASDGYCEMESDFYGWVRILNEDLK